MAFGNAQFSVCASMSCKIVPNDFCDLCVSERTSLRTYLRLPARTAACAGPGDEVGFAPLVDKERMRAVDQARPDARAAGEARRGDAGAERVGAVLVAEQASVPPVLQRLFRFLS